MPVESLLSMLVSSSRAVMSTLTAMITMHITLKTLLSPILLMKSSGTGSSLFRYLAMLAGPWMVIWSRVESRSDVYLSFLACFAVCASLSAAAAAWPSSRCSPIILAMSASASSRRLLTWWCDPVGRSIGPASVRSPVKPGSTAPAMEPRSILRTSLRRSCTFVFTALTAARTLSSGVWDGRGAWLPWPGGAPATDAPPNRSLSSFLSMVESDCSNTAKCSRSAATDGLSAGCSLA
mmetsp:Transcript_64987/g.190662  ORF Transcript_64987/g.190662 Transcript_64987/m.190662 type:complete len:236 (+) Transcript_64987:44-751(+)